MACLSLEAGDELRDILKHEQCVKRIDLAGVVHVPVLPARERRPPGETEATLPVAEAGAGRGHTATAAT
jgi:hypothetical protein